MHAEPYSRGRHPRAGVQPGRLPASCDGVRSLQTHERVVALKSALRPHAEHAVVRLCSRSVADVRVRKAVYDLQDAQACAVSVRIGNAHARLKTLPEGVAKLGEIALPDPYRVLSAPGAQSAGTIVDLSVHGDHPVPGDAAVEKARAHGHVADDVGNDFLRHIGAVGHTRRHCLLDTLGGGGGGGEGGGGEGARASRPHTINNLLDTAGEREASRK